MSRYKEQLKQYLSDKLVLADKVLSIGGMNDDKTYFKEVRCNEFIVLDNNTDYNPQIVWDINKPLMTEEAFYVPDQYMGYFDCVIALNLWEYIYDPLTTMRNIFDLLNPKGTLITNFPFVYPLHNPAGSDYMRYTPEGVEKLLKTVGFTITDHHLIKGNDLLETFYINDGMKARSGFDHNTIGSIINAHK